MTWADTTKYDKYAKGQAQSSWTSQGRNIQIEITNANPIYKKKWVMHCQNLDIYSLLLDVPFDSPPEQAQEMAVLVVRARLNAMLNSLPE